MTSKTYAFLIFLFFFSLPRCCSGLFLYLFFLPFVKPMHSQTHTHTGRITQCHFHSDKTRAGSSAVLIKSEEGDAAPRPPSCSFFFFFSFFYIFLEGAEKEEEGREGAGSIKLDLMSKRGAAGFFVNTRQIKSADEPIVVAGNCFFCAQV